MSDFRATICFRATKKLRKRLERHRKNRVYRVWVYLKPNGKYDVCRQNKDHSLKAPYAQVEYSGGCWCIK